MNVDVINGYLLLSVAVSFVVAVVGVVLVQLDEERTRKRQQR